MNRVGKLFLICWLLVYSVGLTFFYNQNMKFVTKEQVVDYHVVGITFGMLDFIRNEHELAVVLSHEISHIELKHTYNESHKLTDEYHSDVAGVYYVVRAGYNICAGKDLWSRLASRYIDIKPITHPLNISRANYMSMPGCTKPLTKTTLSYEKVLEVWGKLLKSVRAETRFKTKFILIPSYDINAFAFTIMRDK